MKATYAIVGFAAAASAVTISLPSGVSIPSGVTLPSGVTVVTAGATTTTAAQANKRQNIGGGLSALSGLTSFSLNLAQTRTSA